ncbi:MAG TPA: flagellar export chaperone FliS [Tepidimicrobium sp.]|nr:flagellar export chaperone FliS [Tepidimicrobium sp.]
MTYGALNQYKQSAVLTATPEELTLMLYDGGIKFMNIAKYNMEKGRLENAHVALMRAQDIITELRTTLNMDYDVSNNLRDLYDFIMDRLVTANIHKDPKAIDEALDILTDMRDTWKEAMQDVKKQVYKNR